MELGSDIAHVAEHARLFLANLTDLSLTESREVSNLRYRLRSADVSTLCAALAFLSGVCPAREGQRHLVLDLQRVLQGAEEDA